MSNQATGNSAHQPREGFMAPTFRIFVRTAEGAVCPACDEAKRITSLLMAATGPRLTYKDLIA